MTARGNFEPVHPFEPIAGARLPDGERGIAQVKWDGVRMLAYGDGDITKLVNRRLRERTARYPELTAAAEYCDAKSFILDGEIVAFRDGKPSFQEVMKRDNSTHSNWALLPAISYMVFDVLYLNGEWVTDRPLFERQRLLERILLPHATVKPVASFPRPADLLSVTREHGLEGIVVKDSDGAYAIGGKDKRWQKFKHQRDLVAVIGGVTYRDRTVNSLLLGLYDEQGMLNYVGNAGSGKWKAEEWRELTERMKEIAEERSPFRVMPSRSLDIQWVRPVLTVKIRFLEWTSHGTLRQPVIQGLVVTDPGSCVFGQA